MSTNVHVNKTLILQLLSKFQGSFNISHMLTSYPTVEAFDALLPLPFRILALLNLASWLWFLTLQTTGSYKINIISLLKLSDDYPHQFNGAQLMRDGYKGQCLTASVGSLGGYVTYLFLHEVVREVGIIWDNFALALIVCYVSYFVFFTPGPGTNRLLFTLKRVLIGGIDSVNLRTNDILVSDTMISYGKVFIDLGVVLCQIFSNRTCLPSLGSDEKNIDRSCGKNIALEFIVGSIPILIRLRQCAFEFALSGYLNKGHMFNFIKYFTSLVFLFATVFLTQHPSYSAIWKFLAFINSCYGFYWDLNRDWNLFSSGYKLRSRKMYPLVFYYFAIAFDFSIRFIWVLKLTSSDQYLNVLLYQSEAGVFMLQILEIVRRFIWILIKCEIDFIVMDPLEKKGSEEVELASLPK